MWCRLGRARVARGGVGCMGDETGGRNAVGFGMVWAFYLVRTLVKSASDAWIFMEAERG